MRSFRVRVNISGKPMGEGVGSSKKEAEENAAREALVRFHEDPKAATFL